MVENNPKGKAQFLCRCTCGNELVCLASNLGRGTVTCGCKKKERISKIDYKGPNEVVHNPDGTSTLFLTHGSKRLECIIDTQDYDLVKQYRWSVAKAPRTNYAKREVWDNGKRWTIFMHNQLFSQIEEVDHIDRNGLNNRRGNFRPTTHQKNNFNTSIKRHGIQATSRYRGVSARARYFRARIMLNGKEITLGKFGTELEAARAYNDAAKIYFGEFASLNELG